ncbi:hypothetical protein [Streptosporangium sp. NPDC002524]|uniref:hypothetical protein n=1 Tax=Streptosporangium sp. NPDC002524 TaxID=3154537 RepID=UPI0033213473
MITRRQFIAAGALVLAPAVAVPAAATRPAAAGADRWEWEGDESANGWRIDPGEITLHAVEGTLASVLLRAGDAATVLLHVARRWHYEVAPVDTGQGGGLSAHTTDRTVGAGFESNHLSGTAVAVHPAAYPLHGSEGLWPHQEVIVRDILLDCEGTVRWGGDLTPVKASHFQIDVPPGSGKLARVADRLRTDQHLPFSPPAGAALDPATAARRSGSRKLKRTQAG